MTPRREIWKDGLLAIAAMVICVTLYHTAKEILDVAVSDDFVSDFLAELVFAVLVMASVLLLRQTAIFHCDAALLKKGWPSAGLLIAAILYFGVTSIPDMLERPLPRLSGSACWDRPRWWAFARRYCSAG